MYAGNLRVNNQDMPVIAGNNLHFGDGLKLPIIDFESRLHPLSVSYAQKLARSEHHGPNAIPDHGRSQGKLWLDTSSCTKKRII